MAESATIYDQQAAHKSAQFKLRALLALGVGLLLLSLCESDRRGMLMFDDQAAFAVDGEFDGGLTGGNSFAISKVLGGAPTGLANALRGGRTGWDLPGQQGDPGNDSIVRGLAVPGTSSTTKPGVQGGNSGAASIGSSIGAPISGAGNNFGAPPDVGEGPSLIGFPIPTTPPVTPGEPDTPDNPGTPTDPPVSNPGDDGADDGVVPAIPEPSSWILMILGVGILGAVLRRRRDREDTRFKGELAAA